MTLRNLIRTVSPAGWLYAVAAVFAIGAIVLAWWILTEPGRANRRSAAAKADATFAQGRADAGKDAIIGIEKNRGKADAIGSRVEGSEDAVRKADPAQRDDAALRELCKSPSTSAWPECALFRPGGRDRAP